MRARRDVYVSASVSDAVVRAQRVGGRLDCLSALREHGVFVLSSGSTHVQVEHHDGRLRSPGSRRHRLHRAHDRTVVHWRMLDLPADLHTVPVVEALAHSALCQPPRALVASIDSALNRKLIDARDLDALFDLLPKRFGRLRAHLDGRAEAGSETLARLIARSLGCRVEVQREIPGVGRVDLVIDGWIVVECDSRQFHSGWEIQERDRARDLALAALGMVCIRPTATMIFTRPEDLVAAIRGLLALR
ncbi:hypothetical protein [Microbacterium sp. BWT-B31]|uniref:hypothetical protein n=1 Tax=Microbacterium sp. BWT-B31 TaxID=3232072 RepID=UPI003529BD93